MICGTGLDLLQSSGEFPCTVCCTGVGSNSIFWNGCKHWVHKKCSGLKHLTKDPDYRCTCCQGTACPLVGRPQGQVQVGYDKLEMVQVGSHKLEVVASICYLGDMLSAAELSTTTCENRLEEAQGAAPSSLYLPLLKPLLKTRGHVYSSCVQSVILHANETCPLTKPNLQHLQQNDRAMVRQIYNVKPQDMVITRFSDLLERLGTEDLDLILKERRLRWYWHVEWPNGTVKTGWWKAWAWEAQDDMAAADRRIAECESSRLLTLMIDIPGDLVWDLPCIQQASYLEQAHWCGCCPCTCMLIKTQRWSWATSLAHGKVDESQCPPQHCFSDLFTRTKPGTGWTQCIIIGLSDFLLTCKYRGNINIHFQVAGLLHAWQISHQISRYV